jgi:hypothetical protein
MARRCGDCLGAGFFPSQTVAKPKKKSLDFLGFIVRFGAFQRVTAIPNQFFSLGSDPPSPESRRSIGLIWRLVKVSTDSDFLQEIADFFYLG